MEKKETNELSADNEKINSNEVSNNSSMDSLSMGLKRLNVDAPVFVPSFAINSDINTLNNKEEDNKQFNQINNKTPIDHKNSEEVVDDWEANADEEDDEEEDEGLNHFYFVQFLSLLFYSFSIY
jgi:hypothetical protein